MFKIKQKLKCVALCVTLSMVINGGCVVLTTSEDNDHARQLEYELYAGPVLPHVQAFNDSLGGQRLFVSTGTSHLIWGKHASCFFPFWDSPFVLSTGKPAIKAEEVKPLLLEIQRVSAIRGFDRRIVIDCPASQWDGAFVIGPRGKYIKGLERFEKYAASQPADVLSPAHYLNGLLEENPRQGCVWPERDRAFTTTLYAGDAIRNIRAFNPEQGGRVLSVFSRSSTSYTASCYFPFWDSPLVKARGEIAILPGEVKSLLIEMQRVSRECAYKQQIDIECRGSHWRFSIGPCGQYVTRLAEFEKQDVH